MDDYDEFGNYIGPLSESDEDVVDEEEVAEELPALEPAPAAPAATADDGGLQVMQVDDAPSNAVVLHEDKVYYPSAAEVYGEDVRHSSRRRTRSRSRSRSSSPRKCARLRSRSRACPTCASTARF